jgi:hypothetical protein
MKSNLKSALLAAAFCLPFSGGAAFAVPVGIAVTFPSAITVPEDGGTHVIDYTFTNNTTSTFTFNGFNLGFTSLTTTGDASDHINLPADFLSAVSLGTCSVPGTNNGSVAPGGTCTAHFSFSVDNGTGETDADTGVRGIFVNFGSGPNEISTTTTITVTDTPLPGALPLFATALVGLGLLGWRRKRKAAAT